MACILIIIKIIHVHHWSCHYTRTCTCTCFIVCTCTCTCFIVCTCTCFIVCTCTYSVHDVYISYTGDEEEHGTKFDFDFLINGTLLNKSLGQLIESLQTLTVSELSICLCGLILAEIPWLGFTGCLVREGETA